MENYDDHQENKYRISPYTGSQPTERHAEYHGPARGRGWIVAAIVAGLIAAFVIVFALNPTGSDDSPVGSPSTGIAAANV